jgi:selenocysteine lyase/cysteine desulfurase
MQVSRRHFLGATSGAAAVSALTAPVRAQAPVDSRADPLNVRRDFPALQEYTFLNTAYIGLIARPVADAGRAWLDARSHRPFEVGEMLNKVDEARHRFARLINATDDEIGLLFSTTEGENVVVDALGFKAGDNVVIDDLVYPSTPVIHRRLQEAKGVELRIVNHRNGAVDARDFEKFVDNRTRLISVAWVSNLNGFRHDMRPLADLAHAHGAYLYTDAIQAIGTAPLDVRAAEVDFLCCGSYKWLMAGFGVAPFFVRRELLERIQPDRVGWHVEKRLGDYHYEHYKNGKKFEFASLAFGEVYQLAAALAYLEGVGLTRIEQHTTTLVNQLRKGLVDRGFRVFTPPNAQSSILSFYVNQPTESATKLLDAAGVKVSAQNGDRTDAYGGTGAPLNRVRVSVSYFNNAGDIERMLAASERLRAS